MRTLFILLFLGVTAFCMAQIIPLKSGIIPKKKHAVNKTETSRVNKMHNPDGFSITVIFKVNRILGIDNQIVKPSFLKNENYS
jgi:hypothetical protein